MKNLIAVFGIIILTGLSANAGLLLDPYFSYKMSGSASFSSGSSVAGNELGVRVGYGFLGFAAGVDTTLSGKYTYSNSGVTVDSTPKNIGVFASYTFPILVRGYFTYLASAKETIPGSEYSGTGTKIGIQFTGLPFVAIGLETVSLSYKDLSAAGVTSSVSETATHTNLALSMPFNF